MIVVIAGVVEVFATAYWLRESYKPKVASVCMRVWGESISRGESNLYLGIFRRIPRKTFNG